MKMTYLSPHPPRINWIREVYDSFRNNLLTWFVGNHWDRMNSYDFRSIDRLSVIFCLTRTGLNCKVQMSVKIGIMDEWSERWTCSRRRGSLLSTNTQDKGTAANGKFCVLLHVTQNVVGRESWML